MKISEALYNTPEMSEEKLLAIIEKYISQLNKFTINKLKQLYQEETDISKLVLNEYDLIQNKKSNLTRSQRNQIIGFVAMCLIRMTKNEINTD